VSHGAERIGVPPAAVARLRGGASVPPTRRRLWRTLRRGDAAFGIVVLVPMILAALAAPWLTRYNPRASEVIERLRPPAWVPGGSRAHLLGTDQLGRDVEARFIYGARISLLVGLSTVAISTALGAGVGLVAGYRGGRLDAALMRLADVQLAFPFFILAIAIAAVVGAGLLNVILILGVTGWVGFARLARGQVLSVKQKEYVESARSVGASETVVMRRHILPNILSPVLVLATASVANNIVVEAALTFLGVGVQPDIPSWGNMLADSRDYLNIAWWMSVFPGGALTLIVLAINLLGDWLRDYLDPTLRNL
jgi:peptide/nickel transport system permease protein